MGKKVRTTLTIDENILREAKEEIPNLSKTVEETLKAHLASQNKDELQIRQDIISKQQQIMQLESEISVLQAQLNNIAGTTDVQAQNNIWRKVLIDYREQMVFIDRNIDEATKKLDVDENTLKKIIKEVTRELGCQGALIENVRNWDFVKEHYDYVNNEGVF
jgi:post-segregation antitoxin (ccd killing protein)